MQPLSQHRSHRREAPGGVSRTVLLALIPTLPAVELTALSAEKRRQLSALVASGMTASLRQGVEGWTRLASLRPVREELPEPAARGGAYQVLTLHRSRTLDVRVEKR
jgi:hypothetical protein